MDFSHLRSRAGEIHRFQGNQHRLSAFVFQPVTPFIQPRCSRRFGRVQRVSQLHQVLFGVPEIDDALGSREELLQHRFLCRGSGLLIVAPTHVDQFGLQIDVSAVRLSVSAQAGQGLVLGNVLSDLSNLFNGLTGSLL